MFGLPEKAVIRQPLSKKIMYAKFALKSEAKQLFEKDVSRVTIVGYVSPQTVPALHEGEQIKGYYVLLLNIRQREYRDRNLLWMFNSIHQNMVFVLECEDEAQLVINYNGLQKSEWMPLSEVNIKLDGLDMDAVWMNLVAAIGGYNAHSSTETIDTQIDNRQQVARIKKEIKALTNKRNKERQTQVKFALHKQIVALQEKLKEYENLN